MRCSGVDTRQRYGARMRLRTPVHDRCPIQLHLRDLEERYWEDQVVQEWENSKQATRPAAELWSELGL